MRGILTTKEKKQGRGKPTLSLLDASWKEKEEKQRREEEEAKGEVHMTFFFSLHP